MDELQMTHSIIWPFVSVIVPVRNEEARIDCLARALLAQTYPAHRCEFLIVDNDSTDATPNVIRKYEHLTGLSERSMRNAESARNAGIRAAKGEILAFTDGDCNPDPRWLELAVKNMLDNTWDLVAGAVEFTFNAEPTGAQLYDAVTNLQHEQSVRDRGIAFTANLLVKRSVINATGIFPVDRLGGGDFWITSTAGKMGFKLGYCPKAVVQHPARRFNELIKKAYRIGREKGASSKVKQTSHQSAAIRLHFRHLLPKYLGASFRARHLNVDMLSFCKAYVCGLFYVATGAMGLFSGFFRRQTSHVVPA